MRSFELQWNITESTFGLDFDSSEQSFEVGFDSYQPGGTRIEPYEGEYLITPSEDAQVLSTTYKTMTEDLTIAAIPSNYGRISWNGSYISLT